MDNITHLSWQQLHLYADLNDVESISDWLMDAGAISVVLEDAGNEMLCELVPDSNPLWKKNHLTVLFDKSYDLETLLKHLERDFGPKSLQNHTIDLYQNQDWESSWKEHFHPLQFGKQLWICPSWHTVPDPTAINLILDPGMAFGTGTHTTTGLCLEWLDEHPPQDKMLIDYGCGSGILALAAIKLGAKHAFAIDNDWLAVETTEKNADRNAIQHDVLSVAHSSDEKVTKILSENKADLLIANILAKPLMELAPSFSKWVKPGGQLTLSGILDTQIKELTAVYKLQGFVLDDVKILNEWARLVFIFLPPHFCAQLF